MVGGGSMLYHEEYSALGQNFLFLYFPRGRWWEGSWWWRICSTKQTARSGSPELFYSKSRTGNKNTLRTWNELGHIDEDRLFTLIFIWLSRWYPFCWMKRKITRDTRRQKTGQIWPWVRGTHNWPVSLYSKVKLLFLALSLTQFSE